MDMDEEQNQPRGDIVSYALKLRLAYQMRENRNVTVSEVAEKAGIDRGALSRLESGDTQRYDKELLRRLCAFYGVQPGAILVYEEPEEAGDDGILWRELAPAV